MIRAHLIGGPEDGNIYALDEPRPVIYMRQLRVPLRALHSKDDMELMEPRTVMYARALVPRDTDEYNYHWVSPRNA